MEYPQKPLQRQQVLAVCNGNYVEFFAERNIDIHVAKIPQPDTCGLEDLAEQCLECSIPLRFRHLFDRSKLRGNAFIAPLAATVALYARAKRRALSQVDRIAEDERGAVA
ncbi:hypothetical protein [Lacipirellula limnantheis]|uniref:Uncharacterized protein n=1 Tax=Lacipirellula limnantheis TaxID=2528024 RepID=A0A517U2H6_9BACT|nr:hypothetical protein [Lacipirellula limnantheis]QDT74835.1 hypothetical protein I41_40380 [Lacipirellula limnantheis]